VHFCLGFSPPGTDGGRLMRPLRTAASRQGSTHVYAKLPVNNVAVLLANQRPTPGQKSSLLTEEP